MTNLEQDSRLILVARKPIPVSIQPVAVPSRREALRLVGSTLGVGIAGCAGDPDAESIPTQTAPQSLSTTASRSPTRSPTDSPTATPQPDVNPTGTWPQVTFDSRNTRYTPDARGPREVASIAWRAVGDRPVYPPVINDAIFLTEAWTNGVAFSLDAEQGTRRWSNSDFPPMRWAPGLAEGRMFVITREEGNVVRLHALDQATGEQAWVRESGFRATSGEHPPIGPTVRDGTLYIAWHRGIIAIEASSGATKWTAKLGPHAVETEDGPSWRTDWAKPAVTSERAFTFDMNDSYQATRTVYAVERSNGERDWTAKLEVGDEWYLSGYIVAGRDLLFVTANKPSIYVGGDVSRVGDGRLFALDPTSGEVVWDWKRSDRTLSAPAYAEGRLFLTENAPEADTQRVYALGAHNGETLWTKRVDNALQIPTVAGDTVFVGHGTRFEALTVTEGTRRWQLDIGANAGWPAVVGDTAYLQTNPGHDYESHLIAITEP